MSRYFIKTFLVFAFIFTFCFGAFFLIKDHGLMADEHYHYGQITRFMRFNFTLDPELPMAPGYHFVVAFFGKIFGLDVYSYYQAIPLVRFISFLFYIYSIFIFYLIALKIDKSSAATRTLQYSFFPLIFTFAPLVYTDIFSLSVLLLSILFIYHKQYFVSGLFAAASIFIRQNNLIWLVFLNLLIYLSEFGFRFTSGNLKKHLSLSWSFLTGFFVFAFLTISYGGASAGSNTMVKFTIVFPNNLFVMLFLYFFLFLPVNIPLTKEVGKWLVKNKRFFVFLPLLLLFFAIFQYFFRIEHPYNHMIFFLHNQLLAYFTFNLFRKLVFFVVVICSLLFIIVTRLQSKIYYLLYPFTVLFFLPLWFIEQRYYIIPLTFFLLFRKHTHPVFERALVVYFLLISLYLYYGIFYWKFFP